MLSTVSSPSVSPSPSPSPKVIHTTTTIIHNVVTSPHFFQLAQIVQYLAGGALLSIVHSLLLNKRLPKWANIALPVVYSGLAALADLIVKGTVDWSNWYMVFVQFLTGAVAWYAILTIVNTANPPAKTAATTVPVTTNP